MFQHFHEQGLAHVAALAQQPVDREQGALFAFGRRVGHLDLARHVPARLQGHGGIRGPGRVARQGRVQQAQALVLGIVAPEEEAGVARMIVAAVEIVKGLVGQVRNALGIAAGIQAVKRVREQGLLALLGQHGIRRGIHALHLIVDHALVGPGAVGAFRLHVPAFLAEDILADAGMKDRVDVDVDEIVKVAQVGAGHRIAGLVRKGEGVEKGLQRAACGSSRRSICFRPH